MSTRDMLGNCTTTHCQNESFLQANDSHSISLDEAEMPLGEIFKLTLEVFIAMFGVLGNILVVIVISSLGKKKQTGDFFLLNLAIADLGTLLFTFPLVVIKEKIPWNWPFGEFICLYWYPFPEIFYGASVWCIVVIAAERYHKIVTMKTPGRNKNKTSLRRAKIVATCVWVISFLIFCVPLYFVVEYHGDPDMKTCGPNFPFFFEGVYIGLLTLFSYILPLIVISFTYIAISRVINQSSVFIKAVKQGRGTDDEQRSSLTSIKSVRLKQNRRAKKILTPLVLVFAITMLPLSIFRLIVLFWRAFVKQVYFQSLLYVVTVFVILNSSTNPIIYSVVSKDFRKGLSNLCCRHRERTSSFNITGIFRPRSRSSRYRSSVV